VVAWEADEVTRGVVLEREAEVLSRIEAVTKRAREISVPNL